MLLKHLRYVATSHFYNHAWQRSATAHNYRERKRFEALEAVVILIPSGCLSAAHFLFMSISRRINIRCSFFLTAALCLVSH